MKSPSLGTAIVIGMGQVGRRLAAALTGAGCIVLPVTRHEGWQRAADPAERAVRIVCVREPDLAAVLTRCAEVPRERIVLVQNGFLEAVHGELDGFTRGLIYFTAKGDFFRSLAPSEFHGPRAIEIAAAIGAGALPARALTDRSSFLRAMIVKGIWNCVVGLPLAVHRTTLAEYRSRWQPELHELVVESTRAASAHYGVQTDAEAAERKLLDTTSEIGWLAGSAKALPWRNGALAWFGRAYGIATPINDELLRAVGYDPASSPQRAAAAE